MFKIERLFEHPMVSAFIIFGSEIKIYDADSFNINIFLLIHNQTPFKFAFRVETNLFQSRGTFLYLSVICNFKMLSINLETKRYLASNMTKFTK